MTPQTAARYKRQKEHKRASVLLTKDDRPVWAKQKVNLKYIQEKTSSLVFISSKMHYKNLFKKNKKG